MEEENREKLEREERGQKRTNGEWRRKERKRKRRKRTEFLCPLPQNPGQDHLKQSSGHPPQKPPSLLEAQGRRLQQAGQFLHHPGKDHVLRLHWVSMTLGWCC